MAAVSFMIILNSLVIHFVYHETINGWTSIIVSSMFFGGVQLISLGIIGEYISRISTNSLQRPLYIISQSNMDNPEQTS